MSSNCRILMHFWLNTPGEGEPMLLGITPQNPPLHRAIGTSIDMHASYAVVEEAQNLKMWFIMIWIEVIHQSYILSKNYYCWSNHGFKHLGRSFPHFCHTHGPMMVLLFQEKIKEPFNQTVTSDRDLQILSVFRKLTDVFLWFIIAFNPLCEHRFFPNSLPVVLVLSLSNQWLYHLFNSCWCFMITLEGSIAKGGKGNTCNSWLETIRWKCLAQNS